MMKDRPCLRAQRSESFTSKIRNSPLSFWHRSIHKSELVSSSNDPTASPITNPYTQLVERLRRAEKTKFANSETNKSVDSTVKFLHYSNQILLFRLMPILTLVFKIYFLSLTLLIIILTINKIRIHWMKIHWYLYSLSIIIYHHLYMYPQIFINLILYQKIFFIH